MAILCRSCNMTVTRPRMTQQNRVTSILVEFSPRLICDRHVMQLGAAIKCEGSIDRKVNKRATTNGLTGFPRAGSGIVMSGHCKFHFTRPWPVAPLTRNHIPAEAGGTVGIARLPDQ